MPTVIKTTVYKFNELSKAAQQTAIDELRYINVNHDWWDFTYEDAANVGLEINGFDVCRSRDITGDMKISIGESIEAIIVNHGAKCSTTQLAVKFKQRLNVIEVKHKLLGEKYEDYEEDFETLSDEYKKALLNCYWKMLQDEYEYQTADEAVIESIEANEYDFNEDGTQF